MDTRVVSSIKRPTNILFQIGSSFREPIDYLMSNVSHSLAQTDTTLNKAKTINDVLTTVFHIAKSISWIALSIFSLPITISSEIIGKIIQKRALDRTPPSLKRALNIEEINCTDQTTYRIAHLARRWEKKALKKEARENEPKSKTVLDHSAYINSVITDAIERPEVYLDSYDRISLCKDHELNLPQAIALTKSQKIKNRKSKKIRTYIKIGYISTNPTNIRAEVNKNKKKRVEGAATHLINHIANMVLKQQAYGIYLEAIDSSIPFYKKLGFTYLSKKSIKTQEKDVQPMHLTASKIKELQGAY